MADTVTARTLYDITGKKYVGLFTNISDGTGEGGNAVGGAGVVKVDASGITCLPTDGTAKIVKLWWSCETGGGSFGGVRVFWKGNNASNDATAVVLSGSGHWDLKEEGCPISNNATNPTGDIAFTTLGMQNNDTYTIMIEVDPG